MMTLQGRSEYERLYYQTWPDGKPLGRPVTPEENLIQRCGSIAPDEDIALRQYFANHPEHSHISQAIRALLVKALQAEGLLQ